MLYSNFSHKENLISFNYYSNKTNGTIGSLVGGTCIYNDLELASNIIKAKLLDEIGEKCLSEYEYLMQKKNNICVYDGKSFKNLYIKFVYNTKEKKMYFKIVDKNFGDCILCSNLLEKIIDDNFDAKKKRRKIYELDERYVNQFGILPQPSDQSNKNNNFYPCYSAYSSIFENARKIKKMYNKKDRAEGRFEIYTILDKRMKEKMEDKYDYVPNILNFKSEIERCFSETKSKR